MKPNIISINQSIFLISFFFVISDISVNKKIMWSLFKSKSETKSVVLLLNKSWKEQYKLHLDNVNIFYRSFLHWN